jgi:hypothetical protein
MNEAFAAELYKTARRLDTARWYSVAKVYHDLYDEYTAGGDITEAFVTEIKASLLADEDEHVAILLRPLLTKE